MMLLWSASPPAIDKLRMFGEPDVRIRFLYDDWSLRDVEAGSKACFPFDNEGQHWLEFQFKLENYVTLVNERYVTLPSRRTVTGEHFNPKRRGIHDHSNLELQSVRFVGGVHHWSKRVRCCRQLVAPRTACRRSAMLQAVLQPGMGDNPTGFEDQWK